MAFGVSILISGVVITASLVLAVLLEGRGHDEFGLTGPRRRASRPVRRSSLAAARER